MSKLDDAKAFLLKYLADGPREAKAVCEIGKAQNLSRRTLQRVASLIGINRKDGTIFQTWRIWHWMLPGVWGKSRPLSEYIGRNCLGEIGQEMRFGRERQPMCVSSKGVDMLILKEGRKAGKPTDQ